MTATPISRALPLWAGRTMALLGIVLISINLRTAVSAVSPIVAPISVDIPLSSFDLGIIGSVPPVAFALAALFGALVARRVGVERLLLIGIVAMVAGQALRALSHNFSTFLLGTVIALAGTGIGNVLVPALVKRYFPDRLGLITSLYVTLLSASTAIGAGVAAPVAQVAGWRVSLLVGCGIAFLALAPWVAVVLGHRRERARERAHAASGAHPTTALEIPELELARADITKRIWRSRIGWSIGIVSATSTFSVYAGIAWLPQMLVDLLGVSRLGAGNLFTLWTLLGVPLALIVPNIVARIRNVGIVVYTGIGAFGFGWLGLLVAPRCAPLVWIILIGIGPLLFLVAMTLIGARTRSHEAAVALSGVVQTVGYTFGCLGPLLVGVLHGTFGTWTAPLFLLLASVVICSFFVPALMKPDFVEDELDRRAVAHTAA